MAEIDWDEVLYITSDLINTLDDFATRFCESKYHRACLEIDDKIVPMVKAWRNDIEAHRRVQELAEESPELAIEEEAVEE